MCHGNATAASRSLQECSVRGRISQDMSWPVPETGDYAPDMLHWFADEGKKKKKKKKKIGRYDLNCNSTGCKEVNLHAPRLRFLSMHFRMLYLFLHSPQTAPIPHIPKLA